MYTASCWGAWSSVSGARALGRGELAGLSAARYVVAKMLSRSDSWGRSTDDFHRLFSWATGAVCERPVWDRRFRVTGGRSAAAAAAAAVGVEGPWGLWGLWGAWGGEAFAWAFGWGDMGPTLVRPWLRRSLGSVAEWVAESAAWAPGRLARMGNGVVERGGDNGGWPAGAGAQ